MIKLMIATRRRPGMTHAEFTAYNVDVHAPIVRRHPVNVRRYLQNDVYDGAFGRTGDAGFDIVVGRDNVTELFFDDFSALLATFSDPDVRDHQLKDGQNYADTTTGIAMVATETELPVENAGGGRLKVYHFVRAREGLAGGSFRQSWEKAHAQAVDASGTSAHLRRVVWSEPTPEGKPIIDAMGAAQDYQGFSTIWYDREENGAVNFRAYLDALEAITDSPIDHSRSFFLLAREQLLFDHH